VVIEGVARADIDPQYLLCASWPYISGAIRGLLAKLSLALASPNKTNIFCSLDSLRHSSLQNDSRHVSNVGYNIVASDLSITDLLAILKSESSTITAADHVAN
jgi:hypothetical protein